MDYIYDIVLNLQDEYYEFYEWQPTDKIKNIKKVPIYKITNKDYLCIKYHNTIIDRTSLPKNNKLFLLTSGLEVIAILIDEVGKVLKKSSLIIEEADDILKDKDEIQKINIKYHLSKKNTIRFVSRHTKEKTNYINNFFNKIDKKQDEYLLKYIYYDIYNCPEEDIDLICDKLTNLAKDDVLKLYESINKVNLELKKLP